MSHESDSAYARGFVDEARRMVNLAAGIDPAIYRWLDEAERRLIAGSETIGEYQRLTATDYPGTLRRRIEIGRVIIQDSAPFLGDAS